MAGRLQQGPALSEIADKCLMYLFADPTLLAAFMTTTGYDGPSPKAALDTDSFRRGLVDYVAANEPIMLGVCAQAGLRPEQFMAVWQRRNRVA